MKILVFKLTKDENIKGTFNVDPKNKKFNIIIDNLKKHTQSKTDFLLYHELTHLSSEFDKKINANDIRDNFKNHIAFNNENNLTSFDLAMGFIGIKEVLAQHYAEQCNAEANNYPKNQKHSEDHSIIRIDLPIETTFSNKDFYAPLETHVNNFSKILNYEKPEDFYKALYEGKENIINRIMDNPKAVEYLSHIGVICEAIYQEYKLGNFSLTPEDLKLSIKNINTINPKNINSNKDITPDIDSK